MEYLRKISQLKVFRHSYKDPLDFYNHVLVMPNHVASITGLDVLRTDYKKSSFNFIGLILVILLFFYVTFFTVYEMRHQVEDLIYCLVTIGICLQVVMKIYTHLYYRDDLLWIQEYTKELFQEETAAHNAECNSQSCPTGYGSCSCTMLTVPIVFTLLSGHKTLTFGFWLPFIDRFSWHGWILNMVMQIVMSIVIVSEDIGLDIIYFMTVMCSVMQIDLLKVKLQNVNAKMEKGETDITEELNDIFKRHYEHMEFVRIVEKVYRSYFFVLFSTLGASLVLVLYAIVTLSWIAGYGSGVFITYQLFVFCLLPTLLGTKKEELQREIYDISWYTWTIPNQKVLRFMLEAAQQPNCLSMIFYPLSMPTFTEVIRTIYSILTLLLTFRSD
ncbi:Odorant receptor 94b [Culex quinquefasciatus]|uniref:Odorant receptor n=1 Tax=Culex quinquefasciatus TaxID=7176 RepID=B0WGW7_CULQU|nr:Odorant receptor 94b [Culex quinquefasciatus]|eukprot:XP_001847951.1 Odorant receptor 94b [Culex quinquefasciatus]